MRRGLAAEDASSSGPYAGHAKRETARPTAERLLEAFQEVTLTVIEIGSQVYRHVTALSPVQERILVFFAVVCKALNRFSRTALEIGEM